MRRRKLDSILVVDVESTCWEGQPPCLCRPPVPCSARLRATRGQARRTGVPVHLNGPARARAVHARAGGQHGRQAAGEDNEIIEIGLCVLDIACLCRVRHGRQATGERKDRDSILVRPERSRVSEYCTKLTTLAWESFQTAFGL